jgi:predicted GNAT family N-acyltransferase
MKIDSSKIERIEFFCKWDIHNNRTFLYLYDKIVIAQYQIEYSNQNEYEPVLHSIYVDPEYRNQNLFNLIMKETLVEVSHIPTIHLKVRTDNFIKDKYKNYGFVDNYIDGIYQWMYRKNNE